VGAEVASGAPHARTRMPALIEKLNIVRACVRACVHGCVRARPRVCGRGGVRGAGDDGPRLGRGAAGLSPIYL
jgi:hypothetical protein